MADGYAVKVFMYQGADGHLVRNVSDAKLFADKELADAAADLSNGWTVPVIDMKNRERPHTKKCKPNQSWMRSGRHG